MKTTLKAMSIVAKVLVAIFAVIGVFLTIVVSISTKVFFDHAIEEMEEDGIDSDDVVARASVAVMNDEEFYENPIIDIFGNVAARIFELFLKF